MNTYQEEDSFFQHEGKTYDLNQILKATAKDPVLQVRLSELEWMLPSIDDGDNDRIMRSDLTVPILLMKYKNKLLIIDGAHRVLKAILQKVQTLPYRLVSNQVFDDSLLTDKINLGQVTSSLQSWINGFLPALYKAVDYGHQWNIHITEVIKYSFEIAELIQQTRKLKLNPDLIYAAAAFHDVGLLKGRDGHEKNSAIYIKTIVKTKLLEWFNEKEIRTLSEAVEDHRASVGRKARSIYGEIVADADKINSPEMLILRCWLYRINEINEDLSNKDIVFESIYAHVLEKYGTQGYSKLQSPEGIIINKVFRDGITKIANNKTLCRKLFDRMISSGELPKPSAVIAVNKKSVPIFSKW